MRASLFGVAFALASALPALAGDQDLKALLDSAGDLRREGNLHRAIELLEGARAGAGPTCAPRLIGDLGVSYFQAHRFPEAEARLREAYEATREPAERARFATDLGNLAAARGRADEARGFFEEARSTPGAESSVALSAGLNLARLAPTQKRLDQLVALAKEVTAVPDPVARARYHLNLGGQARPLGPAALKLAYQSLDRARALAREQNAPLLLGEALDELSQLYEDQGRNADAMRLADEAVAVLPPAQGKELLINLQWRRARLLSQAGRDDGALEAYQSAVDQIEAIRQDIPIEYVDGRSSFRETLEPIYLGLADLLLRRAAAASEETKAQLFRRARDTVELIKQSELQDYLGDRCAVESARPLRSAGLPARTAVFYPVLLEDRLELLMETRAGIESRQVRVGAQAMRDKAIGFAKSVRSLGNDHLARGKELYDLLLRPLEPVLAREAIDTLIVVPDGALRLIPMGALSDGERYVIERFGIVTAPGLTITGAPEQQKQTGKMLLAGISAPGPAVEKLPEPVADEFTAKVVIADTRSAELRRRLALPSVKQEIQVLHGKTRSDALLDSEFTVDRFRRQVSTGEYRIVHIASHAMFSRRAETSFIMAYDDILTIDDLQKLLRTEPLQANPIDMLTLSACQTAEGDDRAPLGIAGAVLKARAHSALGSLWPVADEAAKTLMIRFYELLGTQGKSKALQRAQVELSRDRDFAHPFYWAPFILVGGAI